MRRLARLLPLLGCCLSACGGGGPEVPAEGAWRLERPQLRHLKPQPESPEPSVVLHLEARDSQETEGGLGPEFAGGGPARLTPAKNGAGSALALMGGGTPFLTLGSEAAPLPIFDLVLVRARFLAPTDVAFSAFQGDAELLRPPSLSMGREPGVQLVTFDVPRLAERRTPIDRLKLEFAGRAPGVEILSVDLLATPPSRRLPGPAEDARPVDILGDTRLARGLVNGQAQACSFEVRDKHEELTLAVSQLDEVRALGRAPKLRLLLIDGDEVCREETVVLANQAQERAGWHAATLPLGEYVGRSLRLRLDLQVEGEAEAVCAVTPPKLVRRGQDAPFVLLISSDTHRSDHLGAAPGAVAVSTPNLDALASRGVLFADAWSTTNVTSPSHVALMTGLHPRDTRVLHNTSRMAARADTLAEAFHGAGWATVSVVSVRHLGPHGTGLAQGFGRMIAPPGPPWRAEDAVGALVDLIEEAKGQPTFAWLHIFDAHVPYDPPADFAEQYWDKGRDAAFDPDLPDLGIAQGTIPLPLAGLRDLDYPRSLYRGEVSYLDDAMGPLLDLDRARSGWVAFTSDHGEILAKDGTYFNHGEVFPDTLHVPLVLAGPQVPSGVVCETPVRQQDVARSLLDLAGLAKADLPGRNLLYALDGEGAGDRRFSLSAHARSASITLDEGGTRYHLILHLVDHGLPLARKRLRHTWELYDLGADPECLSDLATAKPELAAQLRGLVIQWLGEASSDPVSESRNATAETVAQLQELGYAAGDEAPDDKSSADSLFFDPACSCEACAQSSDG